MKIIRACFLLSMVGRLRCILETSMKPTAACSLVNTIAKYKLSLALQNKIKAQVSENPNHYIQQVLTSGRYFSTPVSYADIAMAETDPTDCSDELNSTCDVKEIGNKSPETDSLQVKKKNKKKKGKRMRNEVSESSDEVKSPKRKAPNYFVAVQVSNHEIRKKAEEIQEKILETSEVDLSSTRILPATFHVTLMVMHLEDEAAIKRAEETLEELGPILAGKFEDTDINIKFKGLAVFGGGRVVFTPPEPSDDLESLKSIAEITATHMRENGIYSTDCENKVFHPHLTLFKFKDNKHLFKQGIRKIKESLYAPIKEEHFGFQKISSIQLCQMGEKREDGYYAVNKEVTWRAQDPS